MSLSKLLWVTLLGVPLIILPPQTAAQVYFPETNNWEHRTPEEVGMDAAKVQGAVDFAIASEPDQPRDLSLQIALSFSREPYNDIIGRTTVRGPATGLIIHKGYIVAEWGEPQKVDMTFSVTKSFLSTVTGLAWDRGLIREIDDFVKDYMPTDHFASEHNAKITWDHLLRQTSSWGGTLWDKPSWADRPVGRRVWDWPKQALTEPGTTFKYNDVRVNLLALAVLHVWRKPLPVVLKELVMDPIGASSTWRWYGYSNSWVTIDGQRIQSVSGGGHWGGGMFISAYDQARFGYLTLHRGKWKDRQVLSEEWFKMATTPTEANRGYGFMNYFLNTDQRALPAAPESAFRHVGAGSNIVYVDAENDLVAVTRWIQGNKLEGFIDRLIASIN